MERFIQSLSPELQNQIKKDVFQNSKFSMNMITEDKEIIIKMLRFSSPEMIQNEEVVVRQGEEGTHFYMVVAGTCHVVLNQKCKHGKILYKPEKGEDIKKGDYFGEISLIHECVRTANVVTFSHCTLAVINKSHFLDLGHKFIN